MFFSESKAKQTENNFWRQEAIPGLLQIRTDIKV
jgi:hypothetical protein